MTARIELDNVGAFTCLDYVTGRVVMNISSEENISSITVKMEGISRTRLPIPKDADGGRESMKRSEVEIHRLLYLVETVFPSPEIREKMISSSSSGFTLKAGLYEYPFRIRIPINSNCGNDPKVGGLLNRLSFEKGSIEYAKDASRHVRGTLPPSLSGIPDDEAWIRYFLKVTVNRPQFYKSNMRSYDPFVFLPIEPPRPPIINETYARRQHQISTHAPSPVPKKRGLFSSLSLRHSSLSPLILSPVNIHFSIEARLPAPPIVVPNCPIPFRILLVKLSPYRTPVMVRSIQINLYAYTEIHAHGQMKTVRGVVPVLILGNLGVSFGVDDSPIGEVLEADSGMWRSACLPDTVPPSFRTCNIWRSYQLEIVLGLSYGLRGNIEIIPLILPVQVYSGISPPQKLIDAALYSEPPQLPPRTQSGKSQSLKVPGTLDSGSHSAKNSPVSSPVSSNFPKISGGSPWPTPVSRPNSSSGGAGEALPPTYEDALADDVGPVDGPRRRYEQEGAYYGILPDDVHI